MRRLPKALSKPNLLVRAFPTVLFPITLLAALLWAAPAHASQWMWISPPNSPPLLTEVMISAEERAQGMMFKHSYPDNQLMLFMYPADGRHQIWMKNCHFALDVAWLDVAGKVVATMQQVPPCKRDPCPIYGPKTQTRHFVEGRQGWLERYHIAIGDTLRLGPMFPSKPPTPTR